MFSKIEISMWRAFFWPVANFSYWALIFLSWWDTRVRVFFGFSVIQRYFEFRDFASIRQQFGELESEAYRAVAEYGSMPRDFVIIPLVMAVVMFVVPFIVRRDHRGPVTGYVILPAMTLLCYFFASFLNLILVTAMSAAINYMLYRVPGPDIGMFMVHPLYLIYPIFQSVPGFASQCLYLAYTATVLCTASSIREEGDEDYDDYYYDDDDEHLFEEGEDDWDKSACTMELDRLSRKLNMKFDNPPFVFRLREEISSYINAPGRVGEDVGSGLPHYSIVLSKTAECLRSILAEDEKTPHAPEALTYIVDEMARMEFISEGEAAEIKISAGIDPEMKAFGMRPAPEGQSQIYAERPPVRPPVARWDGPREDGIRTIYLADPADPVDDPAPVSSDEPPRESSGEPPRESSDELQSEEDERRDESKEPPSWELK